MNSYHDLRRGLFVTAHTALQGHFKGMEQPTYHPDQHRHFWNAVEPLPDHPTVIVESPVISDDHPFWVHWMSRYGRHPEWHGYNGHKCPVWKAPDGRYFVFLHPSDFT